MANNIGQYHSLSSFIDLFKEGFKLSKIFSGSFIDQPIKGGLKEAKKGATAEERENFKLGLLEDDMKAAMNLFENESYYFGLLSGEYEVTKKLARPLELATLIRHGTAASPVSDYGMRQSDWEKQGIKGYNISEDNLSKYVDKWRDRYLKNPEKGATWDIGGFADIKRDRFILFGTTPSREKHEISHILGVKGLREEQAKIIKEFESDPNPNKEKFNKFKRILNTMTAEHFGGMGKGGREMYEEVYGDEPKYTEEFQERIGRTKESSETLMHSYFEQNFPDFEVPDPSRPMIPKQPSMLSSTAMREAVMGESTVTAYEGLPLQSTSYRWDLSKDENVAIAAQIDKPEDIMKSKRFSPKYMAHLKMVIPEDLYPRMFRNKAEALSQRFGSQSKEVKNWWSTMQEHGLARVR